MQTQGVLNMLGFCFFLFSGVSFVFLFVEFHQWSLMVNSIRMLYYVDGTRRSFQQVIQQIEWTFARNLNRSLAAKEHVQDVAVVLLRRLYHRVLLGSVFAKWHLYTNLIVNLGGGGNGGVVSTGSAREESMLPSVREMELELEKLEKIE